MRNGLSLLAGGLLLILALACGGKGGDALSSATQTPGPASATTAATSTPSATPTQQATTPAPPVRPGPRGQPLGFPINPSTVLGAVTGEAGARTVVWGAGPTALVYTRDNQPSSDPTAANRSGWNCRVHQEYEGQPAVDWYLPPGTPVFATMDGTATLYAITMANGFDYHGVDREPYLGDPDRSRAPYNPFPGPGGGLGVYVEIDSGSFLTISAHLDLVATASALPPAVFYPGFAPDTDYESLFGEIPASRLGTPVAQWRVQRGDLIGYTGDSGYSEAPHLHYSVQPAGANTLLCPTTEQGFEDGGWLLK